MLKQADRLLLSWGNSASHTFVLTHPKTYDRTRTVMADIGSNITLEMKKRRRRP